MPEGIHDHIVDGVPRVLIDDPTDPRAFADATRSVVDDPELAGTMGEAARSRVAERFLAAPRLAECFGVIERARKHTEARQV